MHGGLSDKTVSNHAAILEVHAKAHAVPAHVSSPGTASSSPSAKSPAPSDASKIEAGSVEAVQAPVVDRATPAASPPTLADALPRLGSSELHPAASPSASKADRPAGRIGAVPPFQVLSNMFEGMYRGVNNLSSDAVGALQRATGNAAMDTALLAPPKPTGAELDQVAVAPESVADPVGRIQYGLPPAPIDTPADHNGACTCGSKRTHLADDDVRLMRMSELSGSADAYNRAHARVVHHAACVHRTSS